MDMNLEKYKEFLGNLSKNRSPDLLSCGGWGHIHVLLGTLLDCGSIRGFAQPDSSLRSLSGKSGVELISSSDVKEEVLKKITEFFRNDHPSFAVIGDSGIYYEYKPWKAYTSFNYPKTATKYNELLELIFGKQEKDNSKASYLEEEIHTYSKMCSFTEEDYTAIRKAVEYGISLSKQEKDADTVIQGWVARDKDGNCLFHSETPYRDTLTDGESNEDIDYWNSEGDTFLLNKSSFPDLTWDSDPEPVEIIIKRKKK